LTPFFGSSGTQKNRLPRAPVVACFSRFNPLILVSKLFRVFSKFKHSYPRLRGRGCIHRTSSTRRLSAAQGARTHSPTRTSQVQTVSWSKLRRRSTRPTVQDNHTAMRQRPPLSSRRNLPVFASGTGFQRGDLCCPGNPGAQEVRVRECVCAGERSMLAGHEIPLNSEPKP